MSKSESRLELVYVGQKKFCGRCMNPFGIAQNGHPIEVGPPGREFGKPRPPARPRALCPGIAAGDHAAYGYRLIEPESSYQ